MLSNTSDKSVQQEFSDFHGFFLERENEYMFDCRIISHHLARTDEPTPTKPRC